jgi:hypothetical protein
MLTGLAVLQITNEAGRTFRVRCVRKGERYGLNDCLCHDRDEPLVEFTDVTPGLESRPSADRFFMARYPAGRILQRPDGEDLWLYGRTVAWRLGPTQVRQVKDWVRNSCRA